MLHFLGIKVGWIYQTNLGRYVLYLHAFLQQAYDEQMSEDVLNILHCKMLSNPAILQLISF